MTASGHSGGLDPRIATLPIRRVSAARVEPLEDAVAVERPLETRLDGQSLAVTLRTPGNDRELTLGFLAAEGVIGSRSDVRSIEERAAECSDQPDIVEVSLAPSVRLDWSRLERRFAQTSACGLCGRAHLESLRAGLEPVGAAERVDARALMEWPRRLRSEQAAFERTGGLHAAALADERLSLLALREDVGRHNAVDKICGWLVEAGRYPARGGVLWVSGRAGAEIVLKAARAHIPVLAAVGAPSSLAVELAEAARMTLIGFLRDERMNVYAGADRLLFS